MVAIKVALPPNILPIREFWMTYRRPGFLNVVWFVSSPNPFLSKRYAGRLRKRYPSCWRKGGEGMGEKPIIWQHESLVVPKSFNTLCSQPFSIDQLINGFFLTTGLQLALFLLYGIHSLWLVYILAFMSRNNWASAKHLNSPRKRLDHEIFQEFWHSISISHVFDHFLVIKSLFTISSFCT